MLFWMTLGIGILTGLLGLKLRWFEAMALLFNLTMGVYLGLYATPWVAVLVPSAVEIPYGMALTALMVCLIGFGILQTITFLFITGQFAVYFPKFLDLPGGGICGFLAGFLVLSFASILIDLQSDNNRKGLPSDAVQAQASYLEWWTGPIHDFAGNKGSSIESAFADLRELIPSSSNDETEESAPNDPNHPIGQ